MKNIAEDEDEAPVWIEDDETMTIENLKTVVDTENSTEYYIEKVVDTTNVNTVDTPTFPRRKRTRLTGIQISPPTITKRRIKLVTRLLHYEVSNLITNIQYRQRQN